MVPMHGFFAEVTPQVVVLVLRAPQRVLPGAPRPKHAFARFLRRTIQPVSDTVFSVDKDFATLTFGQEPPHYRRHDVNDRVRTMPRRHIERVEVRHRLPGQLRRIEVAQLEGSRHRIGQVSQVEEAGGVDEADFARRPGHVTGPAKSRIQLCLAHLAPPRYW